MKSGFRATRSPFVNILAFFNVVASRQISPHQFCKVKPIFPNSKIFFSERKKTPADDMSEQHRSNGDLNALNCIRKDTEIRN